MLKPETVITTKPAPRLFHDTYTERKVEVKREGAISTGSVSCGGERKEGARGVYTCKPNLQCICSTLLHA